MAYKRGYLCSSDRALRLLQDGFHHVDTTPDSWNDVKNLPIRVRYLFL